jgi:hypothetical protein
MLAAAIGVEGGGFDVGRAVSSTVTPLVSVGRGLDIGAGDTPQAHSIDVDIATAMKG